MNQLNTPGPSAHIRYHIQQFLPYGNTKDTAKIIVTNRLPSSPSRFLAQWLDSARLSNLIRWTSRRGLPRNATLRAPTASTGTLPARAGAGIATTIARRLFRPGHFFHGLLIFFLTRTGTFRLTSFEICQTSGFSVDILHLLVTLSVKAGQLLSCRCIDCFLEIGAQTSPSAGGFLRDAVAGVDALGPVRSLVLLVECGQSIGEAIGDAMLIVESNSTLNGVIADGVAVSKVLGDDAGSWLVLLGNVILITVRIVCC